LSTRTRSIVVRYGDATGLTAGGDDLHGRVLTLAEAVVLTGIEVKGRGSLRAISASHQTVCSLPTSETPNLSACAVTLSDRRPCAE
jgi:hypothetical protein